MSDQTEVDEGRMITDYESKQMTPLKPLDSVINQILKKDRGGLQDERICSFDMSTPAGRDALDRHDRKEMKEQEKFGWYNKVFNCVAWSMKTAMTRKNATGEVLDVPRLMVRTVLEADDGELLVSCSSWLASSLQELCKEHGEVSESHPICVVLGKAGPADKLYLGKARTAPIDRVPTKASKAK